MRRYLVTILVAVAATAANAADLPVKAPVYSPPPVAADWTWEAGARYWYSSATNRYNYYSDTTTVQLNSRLTYDKLTANSGEAFFRVDSPFGVFLKGYIGGGGIDAGHLFDEDFPPAVVPYSRTISNTSGGLDYADIDVGYTLFDTRGHAAPVAARFGPFLGYHYWHEQVDAYGCSQIGGGDVCTSPGLPLSTKVISEEDNWNALRIGGVADVWFNSVLRLTADAAYARVWQRNVDTHYFTFGADPSSGDGNGFQLETVLSYRLTQQLDVGVGGRWWHYNTSTIDRFNQLLQYTTDRYGVFAQASLNFGE